jgi:GTP-binding protein
MICAANGGKGGVQMSSGKGGENTLIYVPIGTTIYDRNTGEILCDILQNEQHYICCHGGKGGHGNAYFKNSHNRIPSLYENGDLGEEKEVSLELKYVADVGLVGLPNAGKSTLIGTISNAHPKTANYQFTTLTPVLGTVLKGKQKLVFADIPGLIEGASQGKGLGHEFLKHIERCHILIHLISLNPEDTDDVLNDYNVIKNELSSYNSALADKPILTIGNKIDAIGSEKNLKLLQSKVDKKIYGISGLKQDNVNQLLNDVFSKYEKIIKKIKPIPEPVISEPVVREKRNREPDIEKAVVISKIEDGKYMVESPYLQYWFHKIPLTTADNVIRFNQKIESSGAETKAIGMGAKHGDTMVICGQEFLID